MMTSTLRLFPAITFALLLPLVGTASTDTEHLPSALLCPHDTGGGETVNPVCNNIAGPGYTGGFYPEIHEYANIMAHTTNGGAVPAIAPAEGNWSGQAAFSAESNTRTVMVAWPKGPAPEGGWPVVFGWLFVNPGFDPQKYFEIHGFEECALGKIPDGPNYYDASLCPSTGFRNIMYYQLLQAGFAIVSPQNYTRDSWFFYVPQPTVYHCTNPSYSCTLEENHHVTECETNLGECLVKTTDAPQDQWAPNCCASPAPFSGDRPPGCKVGTGDGCTCPADSQCIWNYPGPDIKFVQVLFDEMREGGPDLPEPYGELNFDEFYLMGYSAGAQMVSRSINEFPTLKTEKGHPFPKIKAAMIQAGGSYFCYMAPTVAGGPDTNHCTPGLTEANYMSAPGTPGHLDWADHPPVLLTGTLNDNNADPEGATYYREQMLANAVPTQRVSVELTPQMCSDCYDCNNWTGNSAGENCTDRYYAHVWIPEIVDVPAKFFVNLPEPGGLMSALTVGLTVLCVSARRRGQHRRH